MEKYVMMEQMLEEINGFIGYKMYRIVPRADGEFCQLDVLDKHGNVIIVAERLWSRANMSCYIIGMFNMLNIVETRRR